MNSSKFFIGTFTLIFLLSFVQLPGNKPLRIKGQLQNCPEKNLILFYENKYGDYETDTIHLDDEGRFILITEKVQSPCLASIQKNEIQINDLFIAPGFNLTITGNAKNLQTLYKSKKITEKTIPINNYRVMLDSIHLNRKNKIERLWLAEKEFLKSLKKEKELEDSVANVVLKQIRNENEYREIFSVLLKYESDFRQLYNLLTYILIHNKDYTYETAKEFINSNFDTEIINDIYNEKYFISTWYKRTMSYAYPKYLKYLSLKNNSLLKNKKYYTYELVSKEYQGKIKEYTLWQFMRNGILISENLKKLHTYKMIISPYIEQMTIDYYIKDLNRTYAKRENYLLSEFSGKPAPVFKIKDINGSEHSLTDFLGKVVYLDLWASWCKPCRAEIPNLKKIYQHYKNEDRFALISIAVSNGYNRWKQAVEEDKPGWLQLIDENDFVNNHYAVYYIPRFILIDKKGKIVSMNAPTPSQLENLYKIIDSKLKK